MSNVGNEHNIVGVDYSLTSPGICTADNFFAISSSRKLVGSYKNYVHIDEYPKYNTEEERHINLALWSLRCIQSAGRNVFVILEDYSFGSKGKVFNLAENTGELKKTLYREGIPFITVAPTQLKKFATGKGNSNKEIMYDAWLAAGNEDFRTVFDQKKKNKEQLYAPITDLVDAYWLRQYGLSIRHSGT
tara:strand:+ start:3179 stop:3745 length:567 start_codon:yes stop_codon:yes gene_type:complete